MKSYLTCRRGTLKYCSDRPFVMDFLLQNIIPCYHCLSQPEQCKIRPWDFWGLDDELEPEHDLTSRVSWWRRTCLGWTPSTGPSCWADSSPRAGESRNTWRGSSSSDDSSADETSPSRMSTATTRSPSLGPRPSPITSCSKATSSPRSPSTCRISFQKNRSKLTSRLCCRPSGPRTASGRCASNMPEQVKDVAFD